MEKPFELKMNEATNKLIEDVNEMAASGIPFYLIELIYSNVLYLIKDKAKQEVENAKQLYEQKTEEVKDGEK